ncbi:damage-inducible protein J [Agrilactobacillus fermenti]|uniref:damage-inducible protein J n=1 Tax=Agrilactobacillus fermenti TaxID=2586909 RepID=UPI003A5C2AAA
MATIPTTIRMDDNLRKALEPRLKAAGLTLNGYLIMAAKQLVIQNKIPFEVMTPEEMPKEVTHKALIAAQAKDLGLISDDSPEFANVDDLLNFLNSED